MGFFGVSYLGYNLFPSAVTYVRIWTDVAKVLVPKMYKLAIPVGLAALAYTYMYM